MSFRCGVCRRDHEGVPLDTGFTLPDEVWDLPDRERPRARWTSDLCELDDRRFIRGLLLVPLRSHDAHYGWGLWVKVSEDTYERYVELFDADGRSEPAHRGVIANLVPAYPESAGLPVEVRFGAMGERASLRFPPGAAHRFADEQRLGMEDERLHEILAACGTIPDPSR